MIRYFIRLKTYFFTNYTCTGILILNYLMTVCAGEFSVKYKFLSKYIYYQLKNKRNRGFWQESQLNAIYTAVSRAYIKFSYATKAASKQH